MTCERCRGRLVREDLEGPELVCLACGRRYPMNQEPPKPSEWIPLMLADLTAKIRAVTKIEDLRADAEKIHAALTVLGVPNLPELPWKGARPATGRTRRVTRAARALCGIEAPTVGMAFTKREDGTRVCRKVGACAVRQATARPLAAVG